MSKMSKKSLQGLARQRPANQRLVYPGYRTPGDWGDTQAYDRDGWKSDQNLATDDQAREDHPAHDVKFKGI